jgi:hypothetical protein
VGRHRQNTPKGTWLFAHIAAMFGIPQVTIHLPEHHAWLNPASKSFFLDLQYYNVCLATAAACRMAFLLQEDQTRLDNAIHEYSKSWKTSFLKLGIFISNYLYGSFALDLEKIEDEVQQVCQVVKQAPHIIESTIGHEYAKRYDTDLSLNLSAYEGNRNIMQALAHWYHYLGSSDLSRVLFSIG